MKGNLRTLWICPICNYDHTPGEPLDEFYCLGCGRWRAYTVAAERMKQLRQDMLGSVDMAIRLVNQGTDVTAVFKALADQLTGLNFNKTQVAAPVRKCETPA